MPNHAWRILPLGWVSRLALRTIAFSLHASTLTQYSAWRWQKLMKRLKEEYDGVAPIPAATKTTKVRANGTKRKQSLKKEDTEDNEPASKKVQIDSEEPVVKEEVDAVDAADAHDAKPEESGDSENQK